ncbi:hypothetical protein [Arthrobacter bambusae]|uniref:hypothetical protein n=1 Tax=Arthrobacter bambusae TaxID=1338426 RepID=UPI002783A110|nr:hypothetical protein [Arthrobacter bambusae]MDQ0030164.1 hypothetical protein [Arthrobacter bambusae]MDQ0097846.1 hypothetical protein [Arthrobacter bambusae]
MGVEGPTGLGLIRGVTDGDGVVEATEGDVDGRGEALGAAAETGSSPELFDPVPVGE